MNFEFLVCIWVLTPSKILTVREIKDKHNYLGVSNVSESFFNLSQVFYVNSLYERFPNEDLGVRILRRNLK